MTSANARTATRLPDRVRLPLSFDAAALAVDLGRIEAAGWTDHFVRQNYSGSWSVVPLRAPAGETHPIRMIAPQPGAVSWIDTPFLDHAPACRDAIAAFRCPVTVARLMRLTPGSRIHEQRRGPGGGGRAGAHSCRGHDQSRRRVSGQGAVAMVPGECWYLRLSDPHAVWNGGATDRVHLVLDLVVDEWLSGMLVRGASG